jgi:hypothetical protein
VNITNAFFDMFHTLQLLPLCIAEEAYRCGNFKAERCFETTED